MKTYVFTAVLTLTLSIATNAFAIDVTTLVEKANFTSYYQGNGGKAKVSMTISDGGSSTRSRDFVILRRDDDQNSEKTGDQRFYVYFTKPADVNKTVFMVHKKVESDDDRWLYLPALDLVRRIAAGDKRTSFVGSNFFYEDVSGRNPREDSHELVEETDNYYVLKSTPKNPKTVEFASYKNWIHKKSFIPVKTEFYDKQGAAYRVYEALKVEEVQGYPTVTKSRMKDLRSGGFTEMSYREVTYDLEIPEDTFTERFLRNPPRKLLR
ncbi:MAG: outer membrane lipoprotein-sorting protein [Bdellovibrionales bacterium]|nr:outer membrane lipoprotein-sorting protein [Bdellovibrionales bacterium]